VTTSRIFFSPALRAQRQNQLPAKSEGGSAQTEWTRRRTPRPIGFQLSSIFVSGKRARTIIQVPSLFKLSHAHALKLQPDRPYRANNRKTSRSHSLCPDKFFAIATSKNNAIRELPASFARCFAVSIDLIRGNRIPTKLRFRIVLGHQKLWKAPKNRIPTSATRAPFCSFRVDIP